MTANVLQGFWKGVLPSIVMVSNPSVNYMLYEYLRARLEDWRRVLSVGDGKFRRTSPAGALCLNFPLNPFPSRQSHPCWCAVLQIQPAILPSWCSLYQIPPDAGIELAYGPSEQNMHIAPPEEAHPAVVAQ